MKYVGSVKLSETVRSIQGAEMYGGMLYAATNDDTQAVYKIDPKSGEVSKYFDRNLTKGSEGRGHNCARNCGRRGVPCDRHGAAVHQRLHPPLCAD